MRRTPLIARVAALAGVCAIGAPITAVSAAADTHAATMLAGSVAEMATHSPGLGAVPGSRRDTIEVWMAGEERAAQRFVDAVSTPGSPTYHQFLSPSAYTERFGPGAGRVRAVRSYLAAAGFTGVHASVDDDYVSGTAPVSRIDRAFSVRMRRYRVTGSRGKAITIQANDRDLTVPDSVSGDILAVTGLDSTPAQADGATADGVAAARAAACSRYWAQRTVSFSPAFDGLTHAAVPICGYSAKQIRAAYGLSPADTGAGKTIALIQVGAPTDMFLSLTEYAKANGLRAPRSDQYREEAIGQGGGNPTCPDSGGMEAAQDSEAAYAMAPDADQLMVDGDDCLKDSNQALLDALLAPLTGNGSAASVAVESTSYFLGREATLPASQFKPSHAIALRAAAEGVSLLASSGDVPGLEVPASDPDVTAVGGTTLGVGAHDQRVFETGWSAAFGQRTSQTASWHATGILGGSGGGVSAVYGEPGYQRRVVPGALSQGGDGQAGRTVPDLAADADHYSGLGCVEPNVINRKGKIVSYFPFVGNGTSLSTPLVAGIVADAEQGRRHTLGFLNPLLYSLAGSRAFHDILPLGPSAPEVDRAEYTPGNTEIDHKFAYGFLIAVNDAQGAGTHQVTARGYDTMTGLGTPNGAAFLTGLRSGR